LHLIRTVNQRPFFKIIQKNSRIYLCTYFCHIPPNKMPLLNLHCNSILLFGLLSFHSIWKQSFGHYY